jgi:amidase
MKENDRSRRGLKVALVLTTVVFATTESIWAQSATFDPFEATIPQIEAALTAGTITCTQLVQYYFNRMDAFDIAGPKLNAIRTRNPNALQIAASYDKMPASQRPGPLYCLPMVVKDNIDTVDMPTTAGSVALQGTMALDDNFLVKRLKAAGAIIIAKGNLTEFANYLTNGMPAGYSSLGGYVLNPYDPRPIPAPLPNSDGRQALTPSGSSSGPAVVSSANLAAAAIGTETSGSILSPSNANSDVGIKPTVGLISRQGVVPIAASQDTAGPITRTVTDAAILLGVMTGVDARDPATISGIGLALSDYTPYLKADGLKGARLGVPQEYWATLTPEQNAIGQAALQMMRNMGATVVNVSIPSFAQLNAFSSSVLQYEFHRDLDTYLASRGPNSPIKTLADIIAYNNAHADMALKYGQVLAINSQNTDLYAAEPQYIADRATDLQLAKVQGLDAAIDGNNLTALIFPGSSSAGIAAKAGYPTVIVPAGYLSTSSPYGIGFTGKAYTEATLISLAYSFEQATKIRQPPGSALKVPPAGATIQPNQVLNYASGFSGPVAPGEMVQINGSGLGPAQTAGMTITLNNHIDTRAGTTRVLFDSIPAPIVSAQSGQVVTIVPYAVSGKTSSKITVEYNGQVSPPVTVPVTNVSLGIFTDQPLGKGSPIVINADGTRNSSTNAAKKGSSISFFVTGEGLITATGNVLPIDGRLASAPLQSPLAQVIVGVDNAGVTLLYAGALPGSAGIMQVNAQLDPNSASGTLNLVVEVGGQFSQNVNLYVQ